MLKWRCSSRAPFKVHHNVWEDINLIGSSTAFGYQILIVNVGCGLSNTNILTNTVWYIRNRCANKSFYLSVDLLDSIKNGHFKVAEQIFKCGEVGSVTCNPLEMILTLQAKGGFFWCVTTIDHHVMAWDSSFLLSYWGKIVSVSHGI